MFVAFKDFDGLGFHKINSQWKLGCGSKKSLTNDEQ